MPKSLPLPLTSAEVTFHAAEIVIEKARRMVEHNQDVVILLDSITRLARAYNTTMPNSGKILSGGVEATFANAPNASLVRLVTSRVEEALRFWERPWLKRGSKMDEVIFEEFKGTETWSCILDRELSNKRIFPGFGFRKSGTRKRSFSITRTS